MQAGPLAVCPYVQLLRLAEQVPTTWADTCREATGRNTVDISDIDIDDVVQGYIEAALWADCIPAEADEDHPDHNPNWESGGQTDLDVSDDDRAYVRRLCTMFVQENLADCIAYIESHGEWRGPEDSLGNTYYSAEACLGHDLRMTSGGHGVGFWDRGLGDLGDRLTAACGFRTKFSCEGAGDVWQVDDTTARFDHMSLAERVS